MRWPFGWLPWLALFCFFLFFLNPITSYRNPTFCLGKRFECAQIGELNIPPSNCYSWFCKVCLTSERNNKKKKPAAGHQIKAPESREKGLLTCNISIWWMNCSENIEQWIMPIFCYNSRATLKAMVLTVFVWYAGGSDASTAMNTRTELDANVFINYVSPVSPIFIL